MIVTCTSCGTRYVVDPAALGATGRTVRCVVCENTWYQAPAAPPEVVPQGPEENTADPGPAPSETPDAAPASARSRADALRETATAVHKKDREALHADAPSGNLPVPHRARSGGWFWTLLLVLLIFAGAAAALLYLRRDYVAEHWPESIPYYDRLGIEVPRAATEPEPPAGQNATAPAEAAETPVLRTRPEAETEPEDGPAPPGPETGETASSAAGLAAPAEVIEVEITDPAFEASGDQRLLTAILRIENRGELPSAVPRFRVMALDANAAVLKSWQVDVEIDRIGPGAGRQARIAVADPPAGIASLRIEAIPENE